MTLVSDTAAVSDADLDLALSYYTSMREGEMNHHQRKVRDSLKELQRRRRASESDGAGSAVDRWVPWKPGDALPASGDRDCTVVRDGIGGPYYSNDRCYSYEGSWYAVNGGALVSGVIAYWSRPLPAPYTPKEPT